MIKKGGKTFMQKIDFDGIEIGIPLSEDILKLINESGKHYGKSGEKASQSLEDFCGRKMKG